MHFITHFNVLAHFIILISLITLSYKGLRSWTASRAFSSSTVFQPLSKSREKRTSFSFRLRYSLHTRERESARRPPFIKAHKPLSHHYNAYYTYPKNTRADAYVQAPSHFFTLRPEKKPCCKRGRKTIFFYIAGRMCSWIHIKHVYPLLSAAKEQEYTCAYVLQLASSVRWCATPEKEGLFFESRPH